jgi:PAS domain S-box-containing protein
MVTPLRLLMIEDSEDDAELVRIELLKADFHLDWQRVETKEGFVSALDGEAWDCVISDFRMPDFDGLSAFALFQRRGFDIPFIFVSGALGEDRAVEAMRAGAGDYLVKGNLARLGVAVTRELQASANRRQQRLLEKAALQERHRLEMAVEASGVAIFEHRVPLDSETYYSERFAEILALPQNELPGGRGHQNWILEHLHPDDVSLVRNHYFDFLDGKLQRCEVECRVQHRDGHWVDVAAIAKAIDHDATGLPRHVVGVVLDLTERKRLESQLRQAQKMQAVGRLAGGVAHDFNNLITAILSFGDFVLKELRPQDPTYEDMEEVLKAARRAEGLTGQLLAFSRCKPVSPRAIDVNDTVNDMDRMLRRILGEDIDLLASLAFHPWSVQMDPTALEQVLVNLAINARDAMPQGGKLTIETQNVDLDEGYGPQHGAYISPGAYVVLAVSDNGIGMDAVTQERLFEPFFTTKETGKGTGLGLATCYGIVKQAGGYIWVYSELGHGTTFRIYLPRVAERPERTPVSTERGSLRGSETIVLVEDDSQVRRLAVRALARMGYEILEAANGGEAIIQCEGAERVDLLLSDVVMPTIGGKELADRLLPLHPDMKVLFMSGYTADAILHRGVLEPGVRLLQKPFTPELLARAVRNALDEQA